MRQVGRNRGGGFTLGEVLLVLALVGLLYSLIAFTTVQVVRLSRSGTESAVSRLRLIRIAEQMRWQLRNLYRRNGGVSLEGYTTGLKGRDVLLFLTTYPEKGVGVAEVGYMVRKYTQGSGKRGRGQREKKKGGELVKRADKLHKTQSYYLAYREFPYPIPGKLRSVEQHRYGPWKVLGEDIVSMECEYSRDGVVWQRQWTSGGIPKMIKVTLVDSKGEKVAFEVTPGVASRRW